MYESQLNNASSLIATGEIAQARMIIKGVLRQDAANVDAWWMLTQLTHDVDEKRKAAEEILKLQPAHSQAQQLIAQLASSDAIPSIGEILSKPKTHDLLEDDDDIFNFDATPKRVSASQTRNTRSKRLILVAAMAVLMLAIIPVLLSALPEQVVETPRNENDEIFNETVTIEANSVKEIIIDTVGVVSISAEGVDDFDPVIHVYNKDGVQIAYNDDYVGFYRDLDTFAAVVEFVPVDGYARIEISEFSDEGGRAAVTVTSVIDELNLARVLEIGQSETVDVNGSVWFEMTVGAERELSIVVTSADGDFDPVVEIYDTNFQLIDSNDDHNSDLNYLGSLDSYIENISLSGTVYIRVRNYSGTSQGEVTISIK